MSTLRLPLLLVAGFLLLTATSRAAEMEVWIDTDPSLGLWFHDADDGFALVQALGAARLQLRGVSVSFGNTTLPKAVAITREIVSKTSAGAEVFPGAAGPEDRGRETAASAALARALEQGRLIYLALGPLTNLATLLERRPELAARLDRVIFLGGRRSGERFRVGRWLPYEFHDANFDKDPAAATLVLRSGVPLTLVPAREAFAEDLLVTAGDLRQLEREGGAPGRLLRARATAWLRLWQGGFALRGGPLFDSLAILTASQPELVSIQETTAGISRDRERLDPPSDDSPGGATRVLPQAYLLIGAGGAPVRVVTGVHPGAKTAMLADMIRAGGASP